jgi:hypothetical protein
MKVYKNIYTSTEHPASQSILLHNENSYQQQFPRKLFFYCAVPPAAGGCTPLADCREVFARMDPAVRDRFLEKGWMYVRNFGDGFGLPWSTVFQSDDRRHVEEYCRARGIEFVWKRDKLRIRATLSATVQHPVTDQAVWFNHALFFNISSLDLVIKEVLESEYASEELPTNTFYGDGSGIEVEVLEHLRDLHNQATVRFPWRRGDVLLVDNLLVAHGRDPFKPPRTILVAMADLIDRK